jgi:hypothetical protein
MSDNYKEYHQITLEEYTLQGISITRIRITGNMCYNEHV